MTTALFTHNACLRHDTGPGHAERSERLRAVMEVLADEACAGLIHHEAPLAERDDLLRVHPAAYIDQVLAAIPTAGYARLDADTVVSPGSREAALRAAGAGCAAVDAVAKREVDNAFCAVRPPGHHAEPAQAMGFCLFNNIAVAALHARAIHGFQRLAVIDFDVHHGNGTQTVAAGDGDFFYASTHQWPLYPGTGSVRDKGKGVIVNAPLDPGSGGPLFRAAYEDVILPALDAFAPDFVFISAGFDGHQDDPLANLRLHEEDYAWVTGQICARARKLCGGRVVSMLEGGYDLAALGRSVTAHVGALMAG
ncbi:MAG: histone deacetylase family protein [Sphingomonadales bacterium]|nr:histone deacetylase family protein [Sphingomonadales bacterium]